jgi:tRNA U34 5-carboxymethylaminomethyl modifying enzyme MnmG/GidA
MDAEVLNLLLNIGAASLVPMAGGIAAFVVQKLKMGALDLNTKRWEQTQLTINAAIMSAEQGAKVGKLTTNADKKKHAMELAKTLLAKQKIKIEESVLSELVEANISSATSVVEAKVVPPVVVAPVVVPPIEPVNPIKPDVQPEVVKVGDVIENAVG